MRQVGLNVGAVCDRTFFVESTEYARSQTTPTVRQLQLSEIQSHFQLHPHISMTFWKAGAILSLQFIPPSPPKRKGKDHEADLGSIADGGRRFCLSFLVGGASGLERRQCLFADESRFRHSRTRPKYGPEP